MKRFVLATALAGISLAIGGCLDDGQVGPEKRTIARDVLPMPPEAVTAEPKVIPDFSLLVSSPDSKQLLIGVWDLPWIELWDIAKGKRVWGRKILNGAYSAAFSPDGRRIAYGEALVSESNVILLDSRTGEALQTYVGAGDYADVEFKSNSQIRASSTILTDSGDEVIVELTWSTTGGNPTKRSSRAERWPPSPGTFPVVAGAVTLTRSEDKKSVYAESDGRKRLLCKSDRAYRFGAVLRGNLAIITDVGTVYAFRLSDSKQIARFDLSTSDGGEVTWQHVLEDGKRGSLADGLRALSKRVK